MSGPVDTYPAHLAGDEADVPEAAPADLVAAWREFEDAERQALEEEAPLYAAAAWRPAPAIAQLFAEANAANPRRDKRSDGIVGDLRHQARKSGHNPDARGVVVAGDVDVDGLDMAAAVERARIAALEGRLPQLDYIIYAARITSRDFEEWLEYEGDNPHVTHGHFEVGHEPKRADDARPWNIWTAPRPATPRPAPTPPRNDPPRPTGPDLRGRGLDLRGEEGAAGPRVAALQDFLRTRYPLYAKALDVDGAWGPQTRGVLREFAARQRPRVVADGRNIGPRLARALTRAGFRG